ncbi:MAG: PKD domain-containing protein [Bacteroidota bacterium]
METQTVTVNDDCTNSGFTASQSSVVCFGVQFQANCINGQHTWDFGDGTTGSSADPVHIYQGPGTYQVTFTLMAPCGTTVINSQQITVVDDGCLNNFDCHCPNMQGIYINAGTGTSINETGIIDLAGPNIFAPGSNFFFNSCIAISGSLVFDNQDKLFIFDGEIAMSSGSEMVVADGSELVLLKVDQNRGIHGCNIMWKGITVNGEGSLETNQSLIQDAHYAVNAMGGSEIIPFNTIFHNNHVGIYATGGNINTPFPLQNMEFAQTNAQLLPASGFVPNFDENIAYAGVEFDGVDVFEIGNLSGPANTFSNMRNGIIALNSLLVDCKNNSFDDLKGDQTNSQSIFPGNALEGIGIYLFNSTGLVERGNTFTKMSRAVHSQNSNLSCIDNSFDADDCVMISDGDFRFSIVLENPNITFVHHGVNVSSTESPGILMINENTLSRTEDNINDGASNGIDVKGGNLNGNTTVHTGQINGNTMTLSSNVSGSANQGLTGIRIWNGSNYEVFRNNINIQNMGLAGFEVGGIDLNNTRSSYLYGNNVFADGQAPFSIAYNLSGSSDNKMCCNSSINNSVGIEFIGNCDGTILRHTSMSSNQAGIFALNGTIFGQQGGNAQLMDTHGNLWNGTFGTGAIHAGTDDEIQASRFFVEDSDPSTPGIDMNPPLWPPTISAATQWFFGTQFDSDNCAGDQAQCPTPPNFTDDDPDKVRENDLQFAQNVFDLGGSPPALNWEGKRNLYRRTKSFPSMLLDTTVIDSFHYAMENSNFKLFHDVEQAIANLYLVDDVVMSGMESNFNTLKDLSRQVNMVDSLLQYATNAQDSAALAAQRQSYLSQMTVPAQDLHQRQALLQSNRSVGADAVITLNNQIITNNILESNLQTVNDVFLNTLAKGITRLDSTQFHQISNIAFQCPYQGGNVVYKARELYLLRAPFDFNDDLTCYDGELMENPAALLAKETKGRFQLHPNPADSDVAVTLVQPLEGWERVEVVLFSMAGQLAKKEQLSINGSSLQFDTSELPNGVYWCVIEVEGEAAGKKKLVILR